MTPTPALIPSYWRYTNDDWQGSNALQYVVWQTLPVYASDGITIVTPGVPVNLTGFSVLGTIMRRTGEVLPAPVGALVNAAAGLISLSYTRSQAAAVGCQPLSDWGDLSSPVPANPSMSRLVVRPKIIDPSTNLVTIGIAPLFVF